MRRTISRSNKMKWNELSKKLRKEKPICEYCGKKISLQTHHIVSKYYAASLFRFDEKDLICLCGRCHFVWHKNPIETMRWFANHRNEDYLYLLRRLEEHGNSPISTWVLRFWIKIQKQMAATFQAIPATITAAVPPLPHLANCLIPNSFQPLPITGKSADSRCFPCLHYPFQPLYTRLIRHGDRNTVAASSFHASTTS